MRQRRGTTTAGSAAIVLAVTGLLAATLLFPAAAAAQAAQRVLFVSFNGYRGDGVNAYNMLVAAGADADYVLLNSGGKVVSALANNTYEQVWVYDLSAGRDNYPQDFQAIADWYDAHPTGELICDGRFLSSYWAGRWNTEGRVLAQNYYRNLEVRGGGLILATDHNAFANYGTNHIAKLIGVGPFTGNFGGAFPVDTLNPLMNTPNLITSLKNDSSTSQAPFGLQPNGLILHAVGYHSGRVTNPGISSTIEGAIGFHVDITAPASGTQICESEPSFTLEAETTGAANPVNFQWSSNVDGPLGSGASLTLATADLTPGEHVFTVLAKDAMAQIDNDTVTLTLGGCEPACSDNDGDGYGLPGDASCPNGAADDCDDADPDNYPGNAEVCDGADNDCDALVDEGFDNDGDAVADCFDGDDDNDGVADGPDADPFDPDLCEDADADTCDDCSVGTDDFGPLADNDPANDGPDADADGLCDSGDPTFNCPEPEAVDYQGLTAANCSRHVVKVTDQAGLDAYLADFALARGKAKHLTVAFNPGGDVLIVSPCRVKVLGVSNLIDVSGGRVCVYGRKEVVIGAGTPAPGSAVDAGSDEILLVSEEGRVLTKPGIAFTAAEMTVEALKTAQIGTDSTLLIDGALTVTSDGTKASSHAFIDPRTLVDAASLTMTADKVVAIRNDAGVASGGDVTLSSTGATTASKAKIGDRAVVVAAGDVALAGVKALIGDNAQVEAAGAVTLAAAGSPTASDARIEIGAEVMAASLSQTADHKAVLLKNAVLDVAACEMSAGDPSLCEVSALATVTAVPTGNCAPFFP